MKQILGLDLGTNSIGWALVEQDFDNNEGKILGAGSRIIPMSQNVLGNFDAGISVSQTAERTGFRGIRRLRERHLLRRDRLHRVLHILGFLPEHYEQSIDFEKRLGKFFDDTESKLPWFKDEEGEYKFLFQNSFNEMIADFKEIQPQLFYKKPTGQETKIPYDWTIYYLRKKALSHKITKEELAWIVLNFNQKRGYYQLRGEDEEENPNKLIEYHALKIVEVSADEPQKGKPDIWYNMHLENGWVYRRSSKKPLFEWKDKVKEFIVTTELNEDGTVKKDKEGVERRSFRSPSANDWALLKKKTEAEINSSQKTVGTYIYDTLLQRPSQKIRGKLVRTIERKFYKDELVAILKKQVQLQPDLFGEDLYNDCIRELYKNNETHQLVLSKRDFVHLFVNDIIFYQRPLRSQKSSIGNCTLEYRKYKDKEGDEITEYLKTIPKSNPLYQEFRLWQWLFNLKIYKKDDDTDVTAQFLNSREDWENLFEFLMGKKEVNHKDILQYFFALRGSKGKSLNSEIAKYRWNYVFDDSKEKEEDKSKKYPCNETGYEIRRRLEKIDNIPTGFLTPETEQSLWHIIYSVTDKIEFEKALKSFAEKNQLDVESFVENFKKFPPFKSEYGSFSEKAIKKLLPLMRFGKYWNWKVIDEKIKDRISKIITGEYDESIKDRVREKAIHLTNETDFQGLQLWLAQYIVYDRHSEASTAGKWNSVADLEKYLNEFKQHSLRNPIVEQVITETLRVVKDIWRQYGKGAKDFFNEIHVELGREMKNPAEKRRKLTEQVSEHENTNLRIKALLSELQKDSNVENVRPYSPIQQETLKIYEDGVINSGMEIPDDILKISKTAQPSASDLQRYKLWMEQKYRSPYTGMVIPLSKLFTTAYEIEHIIPQSRYFDDSFNNKVICESAVNKLKDKQLALEFIKNHPGETVETGFGETVRIFSEQAYREFVKKHYSKNRSKRDKLLLEEIPDKMIARQMNDTRYISKFISNVLSNIVRADKDDDGVNSKNILPGNGKITTTLKQDWGLNNIWNDLILPRFERMNQLTNSNVFTAKNKEGHMIPSVPLEHSKGFQRKRIDHRHHALDALVIACATRDHVNFLNNENAHDKKSNENGGYRYDLKHKLCFKTKPDDKGNYKWVFKKPWGTDEKKVLAKSDTDFTVDAKNKLEKIIVSFKQNLGFKQELRIVNKTTNNYESYKDENGNLRIGKDGKPKKDFIKQTKGNSWAIRKPLHTPMPYGKKEYTFDVLKIANNVGKRAFIVDETIKVKVENVLRQFDNKITDAQTYLKKNPIIDEIGLPIIEIAFRIKSERFRKRQSISELSNRGLGGIKTYEDARKFINKVADFKLKEDLLKHLKENDNNIDLAFTTEGIERFNEKRKIPVYHLPIAESSSNKFQVGNKIGTRHKWVEAEKGTNLFFAIYKDENENRTFETIPLNIVIERLKQGLPEVPEHNDKGYALLFHLSPNDLVYVPTKEEVESQTHVNVGNIHLDRIYKMVSSSGNQCFFVPNNIASPIVQTAELGANNKSERAWDGTMIKQVCLKLGIDRLGNIKKWSKH